MRHLATLALIAILATPAAAATIWDEGVNGDLSTNPAAPTLVSFFGTSSTILGTVSNVGGTDRDYITFTLASDRVLSAILLQGISPDNLAFLALNIGSTSFIPSAATSASFLSGIHASAADIGTNLMDRFVDRSVTTNALPAPMLGPGTYCFMIQQTSPIVQSYSLEFIVDFVLPARTDTWGAIKTLYR